ncbi:putative acid protease [Lyophyllum shimeji]|uniref:Acid protease n=1 Tax=Lyophyllum shimeji TaxID=47721 RepID=A0A9P3PR42_LYOSH|nr:putative acid protease [Lyophyllum shimeji]
MRLISALLSAILVVLAAHDAHALPAHNTPFISIPISRLIPRGNAPALPPTIVHQQHVNRAIRRHELMTGSIVPTSDDALLANLQRRAAALPPHIQKRYYVPGLDVLSRLANAGKQQNNGAANFKASATKDGVTPAKKPSFAHTIGLDIQAKDIGYLGTVQIGTPPRDFLLLMDSGSADLWVGAEGCDSDDEYDDIGGCGPHNFLGGNSSKTFKDTKQAWKIEYGTGAVSGTLVTDTVTIAGLTISEYEFGTASKESREFTPDYIPFDGIVGLAKSLISRQGTTTIIEALQKKGLLKHAISSYHIPRLADGDNDGELTLGALNPDKYDRSTLVSVPNVNDLGFWEAKIDKVTVGGKDMGWTNRSAIMDTGTTLIIAPQEDVDAIHRLIPGAYQNPDMGWTVPCVPPANAKPPFALQFGGRSFPVDVRDLAFLPVDEADPKGNCTSGITAGNIGTSTQWLVTFEIYTFADTTSAQQVGDVFLKNVYMSTDVGTDKISFAKLKTKK